MSKPLWQAFNKQAVSQGDLSYQYCAFGESEHELSIVAMHGWLDNSASFTPMLNHLIQQDLPVTVDFYALDFAGHGHSFHRPTGCFYTIWDYAIDVVQFIEAKGLDKVILLGHSMGACVAPLVANMLPDKVVSIFAIEALGPLSGPVAETPLQLQQAVTAQLQQQQRKPKVIASLETAIKARMTSRFSVQESAASLLVERAIQSTEDGFIWRSDRRATLPSPVRFSEEQVQATLAALSCPVTLVVGDDLQTNKAFQLRAQAVSHLTWIALQGGHHMHMENQAVKCAEILIELLLQRA